MSARFSRIVSRCGPTFGASAIRETSALVMMPPRSRTMRAACSRKMRDGAPFHCGSDGGKWSPMSPAPQVASSASVSACSATSASEWPESLFVCGMKTPQSVTPSPSINWCTS
ncbi:hypothetical protein D9M72_566340 [compost metagenome]